MALDRDLHVAVVRAATRAAGARGTGWEMLAATGVRGLRVLHESGGLSSLLLTEREPAALRLLERNAGPYRAEGARVRAHDARFPLGEGPFDLVDLDPFGSPAPLLDAALAAVRPGGLLSVTATDTRVLAGAQVGVAERRYGGRPVRGRLGPEGGLRLLLALTARRAAARGLRIEPRLAYVGDHHVRAYLVVLPSTPNAPPVPVAAIDPSTWTGPLLGGPGPFGPLWLGPLFDPATVAALEVPRGAQEPVRLGRLIAAFHDEALVDRPFYYESNEVARELRLSAPPAPSVLRERLEAIGYRTSGTHARPAAFRTDAPHSVVLDCARSG